MATWTQATTEVSGAELSGAPIGVSGDSIYFVYDPGSGQVVYRWNKDTDTKSAISNATSFGDPTQIATIRDLLIFQDGVYVLCSGAVGSDDAQVWKYSGSGTTWNKVFSNNTAEALNCLVCNSSVMGLLLTNVVNGFYRTSDGASWTATTIVPNSGQIYTIDTQSCRNNTTLRLFISGLEDSVPTGINCELSGSQVVALDSYPTHILLTSNLDYHWWDDGSQYEYSQDDVTFTDNPDGYTIFPSRSHNMPYTVGGTVGAGTVYYFMGGTWASQGAIPSGNPLESAFRFSDGTVLVLDSATYVLYESDELITASPYDLTHSADGIPGAILVST